MTLRSYVHVYRWGLTYRWHWSSDLMNAVSHKICAYTVLSFKEHKLKTTFFNNMYYNTCGSVHLKQKNLCDSIGNLCTTYTKESHYTPLQAYLWTNCQVWSGGTWVINFLPNAAVQVKITCSCTAVKSISSQVSSYYYDYHLSNLNRSGSWVGTA